MAFGVMVLSAFLAHMEVVLPEPGLLQRSPDACAMPATNEVLSHQMLLL